MLTAVFGSVLEAISSVVTVAEILKNQGFAVEKKIETSTVEVVDEVKNKPKQKAKVRLGVQTCCVICIDKRLTCR